MRRLAVIACAAGLALSVAGAAHAQPYGLIGKIVAKPGQRDALAAFLLEGSAAMSGCLSYVVAQDLKDGDALWVTEAWNTRASHDASLRLPGVQAAIAKARPVIASFGDQVETAPIAGLPITRTAAR